MSTTNDYLDRASDQLAQAVANREREREPTVGHAAALEVTIDLLLSAVDALDTRVAAVERVLHTLDNALADLRAQPRRRSLVEELAEVMPAARDPLGPGPGLDHEERP